MLSVVVFSVLGAAAAAVLACLPGLHVYSLMAFVILAVHTVASAGLVVPPEVIVPLMMGMTVGYAMAGTIPAMLLAAPDESALFTVLPGQKYLMRGEGYRGVMLTGAGGLAALFLLILGVGPLAPRLLPLVQTVVRPHTHWILWAVIVFMLISEWQQGGRSGGERAASIDGWRMPGAGLLTFLLAGLLGFALLYRSPVAPHAVFQNLMPAFVGLFTLPWLLINLVSAVEIPPQHCPPTLGVDRHRLLQGTFAGCLGGGFAAFFPGITGGIGGLLAGHATAWRDDRVILAAQGASKMMYYAGGFLLFFLPGMNLTRGGGAYRLGGLQAPHTTADYYMALASIGIAGAVAFLLLSPLTRATLWLLQRTSYRRSSAIALAIALALVAGMTGAMGVMVLLVSTGIGLLPLLSGTPRLNGLAVILIPLACNLSGVGPTVAGWLGLL